MRMSDVERARSSLFHLDAGCSRTEWVRIGMAAKAAGLDATDWIDWCASGSNYGGEREARAVWRSFKSSGGIGPATLFRLAIDAGWSDTAEPHRPIPARQIEPERTVRERLDSHRMLYWNSLGPVAHIGRQYLEARRCVVPPHDGDLRYDANARHPSGYSGPCLVALVTDAVSRVPITMHRTWVRSDGTKADVTPPRLLLGGYRKAGGVIRLWPDESVTDGVAIAEGIETALSLAHAFRPVWALIDAGNLSKFPPLPGLASLHIGVDDDEAGITAAHHCAERWALADREVALVEVAHGA
jgi:putative DNA primase/helicase